MLQYTCILVTILVTIEATNVAQCSADVAIPNTVDISGCETQPCPLVKGTTVQLTLNFTAPYALESFTASVRASYSIISINFPLPDPDGCSNLLNTRCPLEANEPASYNLKMSVSRLYPSISNLNLAFSLHDQDERRFSCFTVVTSVTSN